MQMLAVEENKSKKVYAGSNEVRKTIKNGDDEEKDESRGCCQPELKSKLSRCKVNVCAKTAVLDSKS